MTFVAFKAIDPVLCGQGGGFDSHTLPPIGHALRLDGACYRFLSGSGRLRNILMRDFCRFLGKIIRGSEVSSEESDVFLDVARQQQPPVLIGEGTVDGYGGRV